MSADNYAIIAQHPDSGRWHILQGFQSDDHFNPLVPRNPWHRTENDALNCAMRDYYEYGVNTGPWPDQWQEYRVCPTCDDLTLIVQRGAA